MNEINDICLNHSDPLVQKWFNLYGEEETYRQAVLNDGSLPEVPETNFSGVKEYFSNFIPADSFQYKNIKTILSQLPVEAQAAFWRDTFYFKDTVNREEANEELFHSVVSSILTPSQKQQLFSEGRKMFDVPTRVKELVKKYPKTYDILSASEREERAIEEHLADLFVKSFNNPSLLTRVSDFIKELFNTIKEVLGFPVNRDYVEMIFDQIKQGHFRNARVIHGDGRTPTTYTIKGTSMYGVRQELGEAESEQVLRNLRAFYFDQKQTLSLSEDELMNRTIEVATAYYEIEDPVVARAFVPRVEEFNVETGEVDEVDNPDYIELIDELRTRIDLVSKFVFDPIEEDQGDNITDENAESEYANLSEFSSANEKGFDSISGWLRMYISTVGDPVEVEVKGEMVEFFRTVDEKRIYDGLARALNNSKNDFERLVKLVEFGSVQGNSASRAFLNKLMRDISGKRDNSVIQSIQNDYLNEYLVNQDPSIINRYTHPSRAHILQNVLKGFDLWSRTSLFQTVSPETGGTATFDANVNNSLNTQLSSWQQNALELNSTADILKNMVAELTPVNFNQELTEAIDNNIQVLGEAGIFVSPQTIRWILLNNAISTHGIAKLKLSAADTINYNAFKNDIKIMGSKKDLDALLTNIKKFSTKDSLTSLYDDKGIKSRLELLAKINALFDETVYESSYKAADGKTKYGFQWKTFHLEFINKLQDERFRESLLKNGLISYRQDAEGNDIYLTEAEDFIKNNIFLKGLSTSEKMREILPYMKLVSVDGLRQVEGKSREDANTLSLADQYAKETDPVKKAELEKQLQDVETTEGREGDGVTFPHMQTKDFDLVRLNYVVNKVQTIEGINLYPHYVGNMEAKGTADFVMLPEQTNLVSSNGLTDTGIGALKEELRKEYDRIRRVHKELKTAIDANPDVFVPNEDGVIELTTNDLREHLYKDIYEKYHTGEVMRKDGIYIPLGVRALNFSDSVAGILPKDLMRTGLREAALRDTDFETHWKQTGLDNIIREHWNNTIFRQHYIRLRKNGTVANLDSRWKIKGELNRLKFENFIVSSYVNVLAFNQLIHGDPALVYKNDESGTDMYKRFAGRNAATQSMESYIINPELGINEVKDRVKYVVGQEFVSRVAYNAKEEIDQADAQNYATTEYKRYLLWSRGKLTKFLAKALDDIELGLPLTPEQNKVMMDNKEYFNVDKTVAFNGLQYLKKSDFMLTKEFTSKLSLDAISRLSALPSDSEEAREIRMDENNWIPRKDRRFHHDLRQSMQGWRKNEDNTLSRDEKKKYDLYMPMSASKMLNINVFDPKKEWNTVDNSIVHIDAKNYGLQLENPAGKKKIIDPSQMIEIIFNEQSSTATVMYKGEPKKIVDLEKTYQDFLTKRDNSMFDMAFNELFDENNEFDAETFFPRAVQSLINSGADPQTIKIFQSIEGGKPVYNPNIGITKDKFVNLLFAHITKGVLQQKVAGDAKAHVSSYGIKPLKEIERVWRGNRWDYTWKVIPVDSELYDSLTYGQEELVELNLESEIEDGVIYDPTMPTDILRETLAKMYAEKKFYFSDELRHLKPRFKYIDYGTEYNTVDEKPISYHSESLMSMSRIDDKIGDHNRYSLGVRIPSQDKHSGVNVEHIDILPLYYGNTIITAKEIVTISGSDFDVDKLFIHQSELYKHRGKWTKYGTNDVWTEYIAFLKDHNPAFVPRYNKMISDLFVRNSEYDENYNVLRETLNMMIESKATKKQLDTVRQQLADYKENYELTGGRFDGTITKLEELLRDMRLPTDAYTFDNPYVINNELLELKQLALINEGTFDIYKTAATMTALKNLDKPDKNGYNQFHKDGKSLFAQTDPLPAHMFDKHSTVHTKNSVGKQNINPYVNGNLGLILAIRAGYKLNSPFRFTINGHTAEGFSPMNAEGKRSFDILSTLISSATDEAKEQLNAKYNLSLDGAVLAKTLVSLGFNLDTSIAFINQPVIQAYLNEKQNRNQTIYLKREYKSDEQIIMQLVGGSEGMYKGVYGNEELTNNMKSGVSAYENTYEGKIEKLVEGQVFVFGSNPLGINGNPTKGTGGAALAALNGGWVKQGEKLDNKLSESGMAWGITTVTAPGKKKSKSIEEITEGIKKLYDYASKNPEKQFFVAYTGTGTNLNGYTNKELAAAFSTVSIPKNIVFEKEFSTLLNTDAEATRNFNKRIMHDLGIIEKVNKQMSLLTRFLKVKKGFVDGLNQLDQLNEAIDSLGFFSDNPYFEDNNPLNTHETFLEIEDEGKNIFDRIPQVVNVIEKILPRVNYMAKNLLLERQEPVQKIKNEIYSQLQGVNEETKMDIDRDIDSYIHMRLYMEEQGIPTELLTNNLFVRGEDHVTVGETFRKLKEVVRGFKNVIPETKDQELLADLNSTTIINRLTVKSNKDTDELKLDTFAKLSMEEQDTLINSYALLIKNLSGLSDEYLEFKNLPQQLFAYWIMKDGFQNKFGSIAKLFPVYMFKTHSNSIDKAIKNPRILTQLSNPDVALRDVMKRFAQDPSTRKYFKRFYTPIVKGGVLHASGGYTINISDVKDEKHLLNYPFVVVDGKVADAMLYVKGSGRDESNKKYDISLQLSEVRMKDGKVLLYTNRNFHKLLRQYIGDAVIFTYSPVPTNENTYQSIMTKDINYTPLVPQSAVTQVSTPVNTVVVPEPVKKTLNISQITRGNKKEKFMGVTRDGNIEFSGYPIYIKEYPNFKGFIAKNEDGDYQMFAGNGLRFQIPISAKNTIKSVLEEQVGYFNNLTLGESNLKVLSEIGLNPDQNSVSSSETQEVMKTINIYSTERNGFEKLSNLLNGPVRESINGKELLFKTVEHAYQVKKAVFAGDRDAANKIYKSETGWDAQKLSKTIVGLDAKEWNKIAIGELEKSMKAAFEQNEEVRDLLVSTGNATLTHEKENLNLGVWKTEFPRILTEIRSDLKGKDITPDNSSLMNLLDETDQKGCDPEY